MAYNSASDQGAKLAGGGLAIFDDRISAALSITSQIYEALRRLDERLYEPKPTPPHPDVPVAPPNSVEAALTTLVARLRDVDALTNKLLHG